MTKTKAELLGSGREMRNRRWERGNNTPEKMRK